MTDKAPLPSKSPLGFSPAASISMFLALQRSRQRVMLPLVTTASDNSGSTSISTANTRIKRRKIEPTGHLNLPTKTHRQQQPQDEMQDGYNNNGNHKGSHSQARSSSTPYSTAPPHPPPQARLHGPSNPRKTDSPRLPRLPDPLPPPTTEEHRYIISTRLLQNNALTRALRDQDLCRIQFIERDVEYLRSLLPIQTRNRDKTRVDVDIIVDEKNGILFYPLREIGQRNVQDPDAGLNELVACIARIGPRYKVLWIIFEEYAWRSSIHAAQVSAFSTMSSGRSSAALTAHPLPRIDPYSGPVMVQLRKLMAWILTTTEAPSWASKISYNSGSAMSNHRKDRGIDDLVGPTPVRFQTRLLFASDNRCAARMSRAVGEHIAQEIDELARRGIRREQDGWRDKDEWLWRDWMNELDSTHERFLASFQTFNLFSIQLILSLCSLKMFMGMNYSERVQVVGKFIDPDVLAKFENIVTTPLV